TALHNIFLSGLRELRYCVHNIPKIISPADQNFPVLTANDMITWWIRPQTPSEKSWIDFLRNDIMIIEVIWKRYHKMKNEGKRKESHSSQKIILNI
ncbi:hypothetical protein, partial [Streptococcus ruminantium]